MNHFGCKHRPVLNAQILVDISVAFLLMTSIHITCDYLFPYVATYADLY